MLALWCGVAAVAVSPALEQAVLASEEPVNLIVTGGAGYVGSHTLLDLKQAGYQVTVIDNLENGHADAVPAPFELEVAKTDDAEALNGIFRRTGPKAVIDFAAYLDVGQSQHDPKEYVRNNVVNFKHVLDAMVASGTKLIVKSSTQATYGDAPEALMPINETYNALGSRFATDVAQTAPGEWNGQHVTGPVLLADFLDQYDKLVGGEKWLQLTSADRRILNMPKSIYGVSKLLDEIMLRKYEAKHGIRWVALRYGNVCGADPEARIGEAKRKPHTLLTLATYSLLGHGKTKAGTPLKLFGTDFHTKDGTAVRDYVHPSDLAQGHVAALHYLLAGKPSDNFNLGTGVGSSVFEVLHELHRVSGRQVKYDVLPQRTGDCTLSVLDIAKAKRMLNYEPQHDLHSMVKTAWHWHYVKNETFAATGVSKKGRYHAEHSGWEVDTRGH